MHRIPSHLTGRPQSIDCSLPHPHSAAAPEFSDSTTSCACGGAARAAPRARAAHTHGSVKSRLPALCNTLPMASAAARIISAATRRIGLLFTVLTVVQLRLLVETMDGAKQPMLSILVWAQRNNIMQIHSDGRILMACAFTVASVWRRSV